MLCRSPYSPAVDSTTPPICSSRFAHPFHRRPGQGGQADPEQVVAVLRYAAAYKADSEALETVHTPEGWHQRLRSSVRSAPGANLSHEVSEALSKKMMRGHQLGGVPPPRHNAFLTLILTVNPCVWFVQDVECPSASIFGLERSNEWTSHRTLGMAALLAMCARTWFTSVSAQESLSGKELPQQSEISGIYAEGSCPNGCCGRARQNRDRHSQHLSARRGTPTALSHVADRILHS